MDERFSAALTNVLEQPSARTAHKYRPEGLLHSFPVHSTHPWPPHGPIVGLHHSQGCDSSLTNLRRIA
jgi:hypothetical protein